MPDTAPLPPSARSIAQRERLQANFMTAVIASIVVGAIYFARPILVPLSLSILLAFALAPLVGKLRRLHFGRVPSVLASLLFALVIILGLGTFIGAQLAGLAVELPHYQTNLAHKIESVRDGASKSTFLGGLMQMFNNLERAIAGPARPQPVTLPAANAPWSPNPVPVELHQPDPTPLEVIENIAAPLLAPLATIGIVIVFVGFILLQKDDLRDRFIKLASHRDLQRTALALDEAADRLSHYLFSQTVINACFGVVIGTALWLIGIPNPGLWGLIAGMFRFVPYVGVPVAAVIPAALAFAIDPGWTKVIETVALFATCEPIVGQLIEPFVYGRNMGLSAAAVVVAAVFWTWLWGPVGLLLSTPLTMCLVVMGRHVEPLRFLDVLLGDTPPLALEESLYLRMLADDPDTAAQEAEIFLRQDSLPQYFDEVAIKALALAQRDADRGTLDRERRLQVRQTIDTLMENLADHGAPEGQLPRLESWPVLCVAGRSALDEAAGALLVHVLHREGIGARVISAEDVSPNSLPKLDVEGVKVICVSYLDPGNYKNARFLVKRLRRRMPEAHPIAGFWGSAENDSHYLDSVEAMEMDDVVSTLKQAAHRIAVLLGQAPANEPLAPEQEAAE
ncbi:MAG TPA: AI-2E family transporter [Rhizomicrobium sp.]